MNQKYILNKAHLNRNIHEIRLYQSVCENAVTRGLQESKFVFPLRA